VKKYILRVRATRAGASRTGR